MTSGSERAKQGQRLRTSLVIILASGSVLAVTLLLCPVFKRVELLTCDVRFAARYYLKTRVLSRLCFWDDSKGAASFRAETAGGIRSPDLVSDQICLIGIDGPSLAALGRFGASDWVVREPFRRMLPIMQRALSPGAVAYDILFSPTSREGEAEGDDARRLAAIGRTLSSLERLEEAEAWDLENDTLLSMTRFAADRGDLNLAAALAELGDPVDPDSAHRVPVILSYNFTGLEVSSEQCWDRADILGRDPSDLSERNGETIPYLLDVAIPENQVHDVPEDYHFLTYASLPSLVLRDYGEHGFVNVPRDADGMIRRVPIVLGLTYENPSTGGIRRVFVPSFSLLSVLRYWGLKSGALELFLGKHLVIRREGKPPVHVPIDNQGRMFLNFTGRFTDFHTIPLIRFLVYGEHSLAQKAGEALHSKAQLEAIRQAEGAVRGKLAMVGLTATGTTDIGPCPVDPQTPYVHVHMTAASNIMTGRFITPLGWRGFGLILVALFCSYTLLCCRLRVLGLSSGTLLLTLGYIIAAYLLVHFGIVLVPVVAPLFYVGLCYCVVMVYRYFTEERGRQMVRRMFSTMVSPEVLDFMEENPDSFSLSGQRAQATVMFSDIAGFTAISERLDPEQLSKLLNEYFSAMTEIIMRNGGYVDKFEGDAIMAEWGVPYANPNHAEAACLAALEQQEEMTRLRPVLQERFGVNLQVRFGICSGTVSAGNMGSARRFQYTVMGDTVNQAARFEPANKDYGTGILIGEPTWELAKSAITARLLDRIMVVGRTAPVHIYHLVGRAGELPPEETEALQLYEKALSSHWDRRWEEAKAFISRALAICPDDQPCRVLSDRLDRYAAEPPGDDWRGEYVRLTKD